MRYSFHSFFLSVVILSVSAITTVVSAKATLIEITHKSTPLSILHTIPYDSAIQFASPIEKHAIKKAFIEPITTIDAHALHHEFVAEFLQTTQKWIQELTHSTANTTTKTLAALEPATQKSVKKVAFIIRFVFKKHPKTSNITVTALILSSGSYPLEYQKNFIKTAFIDATGSSGKFLSGVALVGVALLGYAFLPQKTALKALPADPKRRTTPSTPNVFRECAQQLETIAKLIPAGIITVTRGDTSPSSLRFTTATDEDNKRGWGRELVFTLRESRPKDAHPSTYVLYDNKNGKQNQLIYEINTVDDFTTAILTHLLVRGVEVGEALIHFEAEISNSKFKDINVMYWFNKEFYSTRPNSLFAALKHAKQNCSSLRGFFPPAT